MLELLRVLHVQINQAAASLSELLAGPREQSSVIAFLSEWQTLIAGSAALVGASLVYLQLRDDRKRHRLERVRRSKSARIRTPHALSEIHSYLDDCFRQWTSPAHPMRIAPPFQALEVLMNGAVDVDESSFESIQQLIVRAQAFDANMQESVAARPLNFREQMGINIMTLYYLTDRLFDFGRMKVDKIPYTPPTREDLYKVFDREIFAAALAPARDEDVLAAELNAALDIRYGKGQRGSDQP